MKKIRFSKSTIHGRGIFADEDMREGERIQYIDGPLVKKTIRSKKESESIKNWIGVDKDTWIDTRKSPFRFINHSCFPNAAITGKKTLVALCDIKKDAEITIDYSMTDADPYWSFSCACGAKACRKEVRAIYAVPTDVFKRHFKYVSRPFQRIYIKNYITGKEKPAASAS